MRSDSVIGNSVIGKSKQQAPPALRAFFALFLMLCFAIQSNAQSFKTQAPPMTRIIVRTSLGLGGVLNLCKILGCSTAEALESPQGQLFMSSNSGIPQRDHFAAEPFRVRSGFHVEADQNVQTQEASAGVTSELPE